MAFSLCLVLVVLSAVLIAVAVAVLVVLAVILIAVLVLVLVIHDESSKLNCVNHAGVVYPDHQDLSFGRKNTEAISPAMIAIVIPPAVADKPPVKIPINPFDMISFFTPSVKV